MGKIMGKIYKETEKHNCHFWRAWSKNRMLGAKTGYCACPLHSAPPVKVKVAQLCPTLWDPRDLVHGILQARILEWVAFPFSRGSSQPRDWTQVFHIAGWFFTSWATREAQEYWSGEPIPSPVDLPTQESNQGLLHCRRILYQLSYEGSPSTTRGWAKCLSYYSSLTWTHAHPEWGTSLSPWGEWASKGICCLFLFALCCNRGPNKALAGKNK